MVQLLSKKQNLRGQERTHAPPEGAASHTNGPDHGGEEFAGVDEDDAEAAHNASLPNECKCGCQ